MVIKVQMSATMNEPNSTVPKCYRRPSQKAHLKLLEGAFCSGVPPFWVKYQTRMVMMVVNCSKAMTVANHQYIMKTSNHR